jgi:NRPS condensation-like uncharacterized protein
MHSDITVVQMEHHRLPATVNDQWNFLLSRFWNQMIHLVIRFDRHLDENRLCHAVEMASQAEPLVRMRFTEDGPPSFIPLNGAATVFSLIETEKPGEALREILARSLDPVAGPMVRFNMIRSDHDLLVLSANHSATDAYGVKALGSRVAGLYRTGGHGFIPGKNHLYRSFEGVFRIFPAEVRMKAWRMYGEEKVTWGLSDGILQQGPPEYRIRTIPSGIISDVKERAGRRGLTMNDVLLSSYIRTLIRSFPDSHIGDRAVLTTQDLRRYLPTGCFPSLANLSVAFEVPFRAIRESSQGTVLLEVQRAMSERKRGHAGIGAAEGLCRNFSSGYLAVRQKLDAVAGKPGNDGLFRKPFFTNIGIIPEDVFAYGLPEVTEAYMVPPLEYPPGRGVAASTFRGSLVLSSAYSGETFPAVCVDPILDGMTEELTLFISS